MRRRVTLGCGYCRFRTWPARNYRSAVRRLDRHQRRRHGIPKLRKRAIVVGWHADPRLPEYGKPIYGR